MAPGVAASKGGQVSRSDSMGDELFHARVTAAILGVAHDPRAVNPLGRVRMRVAAGEAESADEDLDCALERNRRHGRLLVRPPRDSLQKTHLPQPPPLLAGGFHTSRRHSSLLTKEGQPRIAPPYEGGVGEVTT